MDSFQHRPSFSEEKTKQSSLSFSDGFFSRMIKPKRRGENVPESYFENWFNFSFIMVSSLFLAGGILLGGVGLGTVVRRWKIPTTVFPRHTVLVTATCFQLVFGIFSPIIVWLSCLRYREGRNQKVQILLPFALGFVAVILMLIEAVLCFQFRSSLPMQEVDLQEVAGNSKVPTWRRDLEQRLFFRLFRASPGSDEMEEWNTLQTSISCCGVESYRDWILKGKKDFIPKSCCIPYNTALKYARIYLKTDVIFCCEHRMLDCINGICGKPVSVLELYSQRSICHLDALSPMGCAQKIGLTLREQASVSGSIFIACVAIYVIAEIIMGIFLFI